MVEPKSSWNVMKEDLHAELNHLVDEDKKSAIATVVEVDGSSYRRPGAKMVINNNGDTSGTVTAGCLEENVIEHANEAIKENKPRVLTFDLKEDDEDSWGLGLGCNGLIDILVEPVDDSYGPLTEALAQKQTSIAITVVESSDPNVSIGDRAVQTPNGLTSTEKRHLPNDVARGALAEVEIASENLAVCGTVETEEGKIRTFIERIVPAPDLILFGGQEDINPVASLAKQAGFNVKVATARGGYAESQRFPSAEKVVAIEPSALPGLIESEELTFIVLMSHNLIDDRIALDSVLDTNVPYIGIMGPKKRFRKLARDIEIESRNPDRIAAPVGLDLGSDSPTEIGFSIVAEIIAEHNNYTGGRLKDRDGPIHKRQEF